MARLTAHLTVPILASNLTPEHHPWNKISATSVLEAGIAIAQR